MDNDSTSRLNKILTNTDPKDFSSFAFHELGKGLPSLADHLNEYIAKHKLNIPDIIKKSNLSKDYAYAILNGNRKNPAKDRIIALCLAMRMDLKNAVRTLKLCDTTLYSKNKRDAALIICFNKGIYDIIAVNEFLLDNDLDVLETFKSQQ